MAQNLKNKPLSTDEIMRMNDSDFLIAIYKRNHFTLKGRKRRFKYRTTNENVRKFLAHINVKKNDIILSVSSSGVKLFEILSQNKKIPKIIIAFDYSPKQVAYNYLLKSAIQMLSYNEFIQYFWLREGDDKIKQSIIRKQVLRNMPSQVKNYLPGRHHFIKRDILLNNYNQVSWFTNEKKYNILRKQIDRIKFCEYEMSHYNLSLSNIFKPNTFDVVYLSNIFDWLCWHNDDIKNTRPLKQVYNDICKIAKKGGKIVLCNLQNRKSHVPNFLNSLQIKKNTVHKTYKYLWRNSTIICH